MKTNRKQPFRMRNLDHIEMKNRPENQKGHWNELDDVMFSLQVVRTMHNQTNFI